MIEITIKLKSARTGKTTLLGKAIIHNVGDRNAADNRHNYQLKIGRKPNFTSTTRRASVYNWPRASKTVWQLLQACLNEAYPQTEKKK